MSSSWETRRNKYGPLGSSRVRQGTFNFCDCQNIASQYNGKCLSVTSKPISSTTRLMWKCKNGHIWEQKFAHIKRGHWCKKCSLKKITINDMQRLAKIKGGKCLSEEYKGNQTPLKWECSCGHIWETKPINIKVGHWCHECSKKIKRDDIKKQLDIVAKTHNGQCLSEKYIKTITKYTWKCEKKHIFEDSWSSVKRGNWCPICCPLNKKTKNKYTIEDMIVFAKQKGGNCLSKKYQNKQHLEWRCSNGHTWMSTAASVLRGSWCPKCKIFFAEEKCRFIIESLTRNKFPSTLLKITKGYGVFKQRMQLDCYSKKNNIAIEYQGKQHYEFIQFFHKTLSVFEKNKKKDVIKKQICKELGIDLIVVPYWISDSGDSRLIDFIKNKLEHFNVSICGKINFKKFYIKSSLEKLKELAIKRGGKCLSTSYIRALYPLEWQCKEGHIWKASSASVKCDNSWCPICARYYSAFKRRKHSIDEMKKFAQSRGGECLSDDYSSIYTLKWKCGIGHAWKAMGRETINKKHWCPICRDKYDTIK